MPAIRQDEHADSKEAGTPGIGSRQYPERVPGAM